MLGPLAAPVITAGCRRAGMASHFLYRGDVGAGVEQVAHKGATEIVGEALVDEIACYQLLPQRHPRPPAGSYLSPG